MTITEFGVVLCTQAVTSALAAVVLYRRLRSKLIQISSSQSSPLDFDSRRLRIVINTLPRVGSSSIESALLSALPRARVEHTHSVSLEGQGALAADIALAPQAAKDALMIYLYRSLVLRPELDRLQADAEHKDGVFFICGTREPLAWALSMLFHIIHVGGLSMTCAHPDAAKKIIMDWFSGCPPWQWTPAPAQWMLRELKGYLGINPMELPFDHQRGFQVMETRRGRLLLLRQENFDRLPEALAELLTVPDILFKIPRVNAAEDKQTAAAYKELAAVLRFPREFVESVYSDPYATTFYTPKERQIFAARWSEPSPESLAKHHPADSPGKTMN